MAATCIIVPIPEAARAVRDGRSAVGRRARLRHSLERAFGRSDMPPHVTLSYPFEDAKRLSDRTIAEIQNIVGGFSTFEFHLSRVCCFDNLPQTSYVWLAPSPFEPFLELTEALAAAFPQFPPFGGAFEQTIPHLTIAASRDKQALGRIEERLAPLLPITAHASSVEIMEHRLGSWRARATAVLSNSAEPNSWPG